MNLQEINKEIKNLEGWELVNNTIEKTFEFSNFNKALEFVNSVGKIANKENHHPDILIFNYKKVKITLTTHEDNGLSEKDFLLAKMIDELL